MKKLLIALFLLVAPLTYAKTDFELKYSQDGGSITILNQDSDWIKVYESSGITVSVNDGGFKEVEGLRIMHSKITYKEPKSFINGEYIHHIYSYGLVDCKKQQMYLIGDLYTNEKFIMVYKKDYELGQFIADMTQAGTAANSVYNVICYDEMI